jgi:hypothetical protein
MRQLFWIGKANIGFDSMFGKILQKKRPQRIFILRFRRAGGCVDEDSELLWQMQPQLEGR